MASPQERVIALRRRSPLFDHAIRMVDHYNEVRGSLQAGAITYFGFLSFFPVLALAFTVVGYLSYVYPPSRDDLAMLIQEVFPGIIGRGEARIRLDDIEEVARVAGPVAFAGVIYAGLGWVSAMRDALVVVFGVDRPQPNFVVAKLRDLASLMAIGAVLLFSVAVSGFVSAFAAQILEWLTLGAELAPLIVLLTLVLGLASNTLLFFLLFKLLARPRTPDRSLLQGAMLGAVGFEVLKRLSSLLISMTEGRPAFQAFGIALILVVWINYFSRVIVFAGAWAWTTRAARAIREEEEWSRRSMEELTRVDLREGPDSSLTHDHHDHHDHGDRDRGRTTVAAAAGAAAMLAVVGVVRRRGEP